MLMQVEGLFSIRDRKESRLHPVLEFCSAIVIAVRRQSLLVVIPFDKDVEQATLRLKLEALLPFSSSASSASL